MANKEFNANSPPRVLILGIGNLLWADEGFGVRAVETLQQHYDLPDNVQAMDGGTQGIYLIQHVRDADILVVFDAVDYGLPSGTLKLIHDEQVPRFLGAKKVSLHQTGFQEVLAMAEMLGDYPRHLLLVGVQPVELDDFGGSLRPAVKAQIQPAIAAALAYLQQFAIAISQRKSPAESRANAFGSIADMARYEGERPSDSQACRAGDARVLHSSRYQLAYRPTAIEGLSVAVDQHLDSYRNTDDEER